MRECQHPMVAGFWTHVVPRGVINWAFLMSQVTRDNIEVIPCDRQKVKNWILYLLCFLPNFGFQVIRQNDFQRSGGSQWRKYYIRYMITTVFDSNNTWDCFTLRASCYQWRVNYSGGAGGEKEADHQFSKLAESLPASFSPFSHDQRSTVIACPNPKIWPQWENDRVQCSTFVVGSALF